MDYVSSKTMGVLAIRLPSESMFSFELSVYSIFGIPLTVSPAGLVMDVDRQYSLVKALDGDNNKPKQFFLNSGSTGSALEHSVPEQLWSTTDNPAYGISAVTVSKTNITYNGWTGCGYIIIDPDTGAGAYMISGGWLMIISVISVILLVIAGVAICVSQFELYPAGLALIGEGFYFIGFGLCLLLNDYEHLLYGIGMLITGLLAAYIPITLFGILVVQPKIEMSIFIIYVVFQDWIDQKIKEIFETSK